MKGQATDMDIEENAGTLRRRRERTEARRRAASEQDARIERHTRPQLADEQPADVSLLDRVKQETAARAGVIADDHQPESVVPVETLKPAGRHPVKRRKLFDPAKDSAEIEPAYGSDPGLECNQPAADSLSWWARG